MSLAKNSFLYLISTLCIKATSFILLPFYSYLITPEEYGYVYVTSAFVTFMSLFMIVSLNGAIQRFYFECKNEKEIKTLYTNILCIVVIFVICIGGILLLNKNKIANLIGLPINYFNYAIYISMISAFYPLILSLLYVSEKAKQVSLTSISLGIIGIIIQLTMVLNSEDKTLALIQTMLYNAILSFIIFLIYSRKYLTIPNFNLNKINRYLKYSISQFPSDVSVWFISFSDRILLNKMQGSHDTGIYGMGSTMGQIPQILFHSVNKAYVPFVFKNFKSHEKGEAQALNNVVSATTYLISILAGVITTLIIFSNNIIELFAPQFKASAYIMPLILTAIFIDCNRIIFMNPLSYNIKYIKIKSFIWIFAAISNIGLNLILIPRYSAIGACASIITSYSITLLFILIYSQKALPVPYEKKKLIKIILFSFLFGMFYFIGDGINALLIKIPFSILYYYFLLKLNHIKLQNIKELCLNSLSQTTKKFQKK